jgi:hypothetical protein
MRHSEVAATKSGNSLWCGLLLLNENAKTVDESEKGTRKTRTNNQM